MNTPAKAAYGPLSYTSYDSPLGTLYAAMDGPALIALTFCSTADSLKSRLERRSGSSLTLRCDSLPFTPLLRELDRYFSGRPVDFPVTLKVFGSDFDRSVWRAIAEIPRGSLRSYAFIASKIGRPRACRAVAGACARNVIPIVIPCHRVVRSDGSLGGWSGGGGLEVKEKLLTLEGVILKRGGVVLP